MTTRTLQDFSAVPDEEFMEMLDALSEQEQTVLLLLRGVGGSEPMSHEEAGRELGVTAEEAEQIEAKALESLERMNSGWKQGSIILFHGDGTAERF